jgi:hypothetical protein
MMTKAISMKTDKLQIGLNFENESPKRIIASSIYCLMTTLEMGGCKQVEQKLQRNDHGKIIKMTD